MNVVTYRTEHFEFRVPIDDWNKNKIPLPEGAGAKFIAPSNLTAILLKPFYYDWRYETDGRVNKLFVDSESLVYGEEWVGKEVCLFPFCKELLDFLEWLKKEYGWYIFTSWRPFYDTVRRSLAIKQEIDPSKVSEEEVPITFRKYYKLGFSGYVWRGVVGSGLGAFWSASEGSASSTHCLSFDSRIVSPENQVFSCSAQSVRCVSE